MGRDKEKERGRSRRAFTKELMKRLDTCLNEVPFQMNKRSDRRGKLGSGRTVACSILSPVSAALRSLATCTSSAARPSGMPFLLQQSRFILRLHQAPSLLAEARDVLRKMKELTPGGGPLTMNSSSRKRSSRHKEGVEDDVLAAGLMATRQALVFRVVLPTGKIIHWNKALQERWMPESLALKMRLSMMVHPDDYDRLISITSSLINSTNHGQTSTPVNEYMKLMRIQNDHACTRHFRWSYVREYRLLTVSALTIQTQFVSLGPRSPLRLIAPHQVQLQTASLVRQDGAVHVVFVATDSKISAPAQSLGEFQKPCWDEGEQEMLESLSGIYQFDVRRSKDSPIDVLFELRNNRYHYTSTLSEHASGLATAINQVVSNWFQSACRSVGSQLLQHLKFHLNVEPRPGQPPWLTVHASITAHSKWKLVMSGPADGTFMNGRKRADGSEAAVNISIAQGLGSSKFSFVSHEYRAECATSSQQSHFQPPTYPHVKIEDNTSPTNSVDRQDKSEVVVQRCISFQEDMAGNISGANFFVIVGTKSERRFDFHIAKTGPPDPTIVFEEHDYIPMVHGHPVK